MSTQSSHGQVLCGAWLRLLLLTLFPPLTLLPYVPFPCLESEDNGEAFLLPRKTVSLCKVLCDSLALQQSRVGCKAQAGGLASGSKRNTTPLGFGAPSPFRAVWHPTDLIVSPRRVQGIVDKLGEDTFKLSLACDPVTNPKLDE